MMPGRDRDQSSTPSTSGMGSTSSGAGSTGAGKDDMGDEF
jgi:hypothetical protein